MKRLTAIILFLVCVSLAFGQAEGYSIKFNSADHYFYPHVTVKNDGNRPCSLEFSYDGGTTWTSFGSGTLDLAGPPPTPFWKWMSFYPTATTIPAGGTYDVPMWIRMFYPNTPFEGDYTLSASFHVRGVYTSPAATGPVAGGVITLPVHIKFPEPQWYSEPYPQWGPVLSVRDAAPPPSVKVTAIVDAVGAGARFTRLVSFAGNAYSPEPVTVVEGPNVLINSNNPGDYEVGSKIQLIDTTGYEPFVMGEATFFPDQFGNYDLTFNANGNALPPTGVVVVMGQIGLSGKGRIITDGHEGTPYEFDFLPNTGEMARQTWDPATLVADGAKVKVEWVEMSGPLQMGEWQKVAEGIVAKAPDGSFAMNLTAKGKVDPNPPDPDAAVYRLDAVSYESSGKVIQLEVDGVRYTPAGGGELGGDPVNGQRKLFEVSMPNPEFFAGKPYKWVLSGTLGGQAVSAVSVGEGISNSFLGQIGSVGGVESGKVVGFVMENSLTIGNQIPEPETVPPNAFDPEDPPEDPESPEGQKHAEQKMNYESVRKAVADALAESSGTAQPSPNGPSTKEGAGAAKAAGEAAGSFSGAVGAAGAAVAGGSEGGGLKPGTFSGSSSSLTLNLPVWGVRTVDLSDLEPWPSLIRVVFLGWVSWVSVLAGIRTFRSAFAG